MAHWQTLLDRWRTAELIDDSTAQRIRAWEQANSREAGHSRLAQIAFGLGGLLLAAGVLLFVAAHWDELSPAWRFTLVLSMVAIFHVAAVAVNTRSAALATTLHAVGTAALGAGIFLTGQIFNMAEHWPGALMLWAVGAGAGLFLLRDWPHVLWVAILVPAWLVGEWIELHSIRFHSMDTPALAGCVLLALVYLNARAPHSPSSSRTALAQLGAAAILPLGIWFGVETDDFHRHLGNRGSSDWSLMGWAFALALPTALAVYLRRRDAAFLLPAIAWIVLVAVLRDHSDVGELLMYALYALLSIGLVYWGVRDQQRLTVNIGVLGFALTLAFFYFASLFDKLGRSLGLIGMGVVFIGGGWFLERTRRRLIERIDRSTP